MKTRLFTTLLSVMASICWVNATTASGTCGANLTWELSGSVLTISGTGAMTDWDYTYTMISFNNFEPVSSSPFVAYRYTIKSVVIEEGVTTIGSSAFLHCDTLKSITIPNSVTSIGSAAFWYCNKLEKVNISSIEAWCNIDFEYYNSNPLCYAKHLYINNSEVLNVTIPNTITKIRNYVFYDCSDLTSVTIPNSVTSIGDDAFSGCSSLTSITIPNSVTCIGDDAFSRCSGLTSISIPNSVTSIGEKAFFNCRSLPSIIIPNSVTSIGDDAFYDCSSLPIIDNIRYADTYLVKTVKSLSSYSIKSGTRFIGSSAFHGRSSLTSITIPNSVISIGGLAFYECSSLTSVTIPNSVTSIGKDAFYKCTSLLSITCLATTPPSLEKDDIYGTDVFAFVDCSKVPLYVPAGSEAAYKAASTWKNFNPIVPVQVQAEAMPIEEDAMIRVGTDSVKLKWFSVDGAATYTIEEHGTRDTLRMLTLDAQGQLQDIRLDTVADNETTNAVLPSTTDGWQYILTSLDINAEYTYTVTARDENGVILCAQTLTPREELPIDDPGDDPLPEVHTWTIVGGSPAFGSQWDIENTNNDMLLQEDGTYKWEKTNQELSAGTIEFKICYDHGWSTVYPGDNNYVLAISEAGTYTITITFNPETHDIIATATKEIPQMNTCAEVNANTEQNVEMALGEVTVLYVRLPHIYVQDNTATTLIYSNQYANLQAGDHVQGIVGLAKSFRGLPELAPTTPFADLIISSDGAPQIEDAVTIPSMNDINRVMMLRRVNMPDATFPSSKTTIYGTFMGAELAFVNYWKDSYTFNSTKTYDILGCVGNYNGELQIYVSEITETPTSSETPTGMKDINHTNITATKKMINGHLFILRDGKIFNAQGARVK